MEVFIDDNRIEQAGAPSGTLEETVRHLQQDRCEPGRLVVAVRCDGKEIETEEMAATMRRPADSWQKLELFTGTPGGLVLGAMTQASALLSQTEEHYGKAAVQLNEGNTKIGIEMLAECISVWQQVHEAVGKSIQMLGLDPDAVVVNDITLTQAVSRPKDALLQIKNALQAGDHVLLADILQYELQEVTELWHAVLIKIRREAEKLEDPDA